MRSAFKAKPPRYPTNWNDFPAGEHIRHAVNAVCCDYAERIFGYHFAKLGSLSADINLDTSPIRHHINHVPFSDLASEQPHHNKAKEGFPNHNASGISLGSDKREPKISRENTVVGQSHCLPFAENSIDGFLLANELDFAQDPHEILREVDRVITQNGYVIISGFNPLSLAGIAKFLPVKRGNILHDARFFTSYRIKDWLQLLGFEIVEQRQVMFSTLFFQQKWKGAVKLQDYLASYLPWCSAVYVILAKKRVIPMTAIKPKRNLKPRFSAVGASVRTSTMNRTLR
ncbi:SAM-dependent methyltransferase [Alteromonas macleodii]|uniref:class I SAM-dependent methyltransferase n=1 Tax=Alteromonas macleodii TaxID=28108 RepID=UPI00057FE2AE|nr:methyltransferase domain-containing protein [Alteromonas macleodii]KHT56161.1 SAM-dependent methyltransferase [Alteromonas macleodii]MEC8966361.1 methyltransferase domain-containing protein [Pseudomonadota bacterium]MEC9169696.1 methyltransferase domain-containing protein [Pseudomonadota bacterium]